MWLILLIVGVAFIRFNKKTINMVKNGILVLGRFLIQLGTDNGYHINGEEFLQKLLPDLQY